MKFNLIPFGFHQKSQKLLDIANLPRGKVCGCICPSCKTPLIARHGNVKEWHFAHASLDIFDKTEKKCEYLFFVSVRMMARQIIGEELSISLPPYEDAVSEYIPDYGEVSIPFTVAKAQEITLVNVELEHSILDAVVDVSGNINQFNFIIYFIHLGREVPEPLINPTDNNFGIISISLLELELLFLGVKDSNKTYQAILYDFLVSDLVSKKWLFHPWYEKSKLNAISQLEETTRIKKQELYNSQIAEREIKKQLLKLSNKREEDRKNLIDNRSQRMANFKCLMCGSKWQGLNPGGSECPSCKNIILRTGESHVE